MKAKLRPAALLLVLGIFFGLVTPAWAATVVTSNVPVGFYNNTQHLTHFDGTNYYLFYEKLNDTNIYWKYSSDGVSWSVEQTLSPSGRIGEIGWSIWWENDSEGVLMVGDSVALTVTFHKITISAGPTVTLSGAELHSYGSGGYSHMTVTMAGGTVFALRLRSGDFVLYKRNAAGFPDGTGTYVRNVSVDSGRSSDNVLLVPYSTAKVLMVYGRDPGGTASDGWSSLTWDGTTIASQVNLFQSGNSSILTGRGVAGVRISDTEFRVLLASDGVTAGKLTEWTWNGTNWTTIAKFPIDSILGNTCYKQPALVRDRISGDLYAFAQASCDTNTPIYRYKKTGGTWGTRTLADDSESAARSIPVTAYSDPPPGSSRTSGQLLWGYRVANGTNYDLKVGSQLLGCGAAPAPVSYVAATAGNGSTSAPVTIYWESPLPVLIVRDPSSSALNGEAPTNGTPYTAGTQPGGSLGTATVAHVGTAAATSFTETMANGTYYYKVFANNARCYSSGTPTAGVVARPAGGANSPTWSYALAGGSILKGGTAGTGALYATSNARRIVSLNTPDGSQSWAPAPTNAAIQAWLSSLPLGSGGIKSVQYGTATLTTETTLNVGPITSVNLASSILFFSVRGGDTTPPDSAVRGQLTSPTNIQFNRAQNGPTMTIKWYVAEFKGGVSVQRGTAAFANMQTVNVAISPVKLASTFVLISQDSQFGSSLFGSDDFTRARLTSSRNLELSIAAAPSTLNVDWQVVSMAAASVQSGDLSLATTDLSKTVDLTLPPYSPVEFPTTKSFLAMSWNSDNGGTAIGANFMRGRITSSTQLTFDRGTTQSGGNINLTWFLVTLNDGSTAPVQSGNGSFAAGSNTPTAPQTLSRAVDLTRSVAFVSGPQRGGSTPYPGDIDTTDDASVAWFTADLGSSSPSTTLQLTRSTATSATAEAAWFVVEFSQTSASPVVFGVDMPVPPVADGARVYSVDATLGSTNWPGATMPNGWQPTGLPGADQFQAAPPVQVQSWSTSGLGSFQATYTGDVVFAATLNTLGSFNTNNKVFALDAGTGDILWTFSPGNMDGVYGMPWVDYARDRLYVTSHAGSAGTQQSLWVIKTVAGEGVLKGQAMSCPVCASLGHLETSPTLSYDGLTLYVGDTTGTLYAIKIRDQNDPDNLTLKWSRSDGNGAIVGFVWEDFGTRGRLYYATANGTVQCVQDNPTSGSPCGGWIPTSVPGPSTPLLLGTTPNGTLYVGSWDPAAAPGQKGRLYKINPVNGGAVTVVVGDGEKRPGDVSTETVNEIFVGTTEGVIYRFAP